MMRYRQLRTRVCHKLIANQATRTGPSYIPLELEIFLRDHGMAVHHIDSYVLVYVTTTFSIRSLAYPARDVRLFSVVAE